MMMIFCFITTFLVWFCLIVLAYWNISLQCVFILTRYPDCQANIIGPGSHIEYPTGTKNLNFVEDHPMNIPAKFGSNWPSGFGEEAWNVKSSQTMNDRRQTPSDGNSSRGPYLWSRWTKNKNYIMTIYYLVAMCIKFQRSSSLKLMNWLNPNCKWMIIGMSFTKFLFFMPIRNPRWPPSQDID
jgi:hypothetical protein